MTAYVRVLVVVVLCALAACGDDKAPSAPTSTSSAPVFVPTGLSTNLTQMLNGLVAYITSVTAENQASLQNNQQFRTQYQAKISALQSPTLFADIINGRRWHEGQAASSIGPAIPIAMIFMLDGMRAEAADGMRVLETAAPVLEEFFNVPFPTGRLRVWYGFKVGSNGGGGGLWVEDRTTYQSRGPVPLIYDAMLIHEMAHSYMLNEAMNQFLELYAYNVPRTGSTDATAWSFTRSWTPGLSTNQGSAALLDVYQLIGHDAMRNAYRAVYPLRPQYGLPLTAAMIEAFLSQVPAEHQAIVAAKLATIIA